MFCFVLRSMLFSVEEFHNGQLDGDTEQYFEGVGQILCGHPSIKKDAESCY